MSSRGIRIIEKLRELEAELRAKRKRLTELTAVKAAMKAHLVEQELNISSLKDRLEEERNAEKEAAANVFYEVV